MTKNFSRGFLLVLLICAQPACSCLPGFDVEHAKEGGFVAHSTEYCTTFAFFRPDPVTGEPSASLQINNGPLISYHGLGAKEGKKGHSTFYVKGKGIYFDDDLDGLPDRLLHVNAKMYNIKLEIKEK